MVGDSMTRRFLLSYLGAVLCIAFVIDRWLNRRYPEPPPWEEPEGVQPADPRPNFLLTLYSADPNVTVSEGSIRSSAGPWLRN
jgi:hypothetical protein